MTGIIDLLTFATVTLPGIERDLKAAGRGIVGKAAEIIARRARSKIGNQQEGWPDLAPSTLKDKASHGYQTPAP